MAVEHLMVAAPLAPAEVGREYTSLPPHMTLFPWFELPTVNWPGFDKALGAVIEEGALQPTIRGGNALAPASEAGSLAVRRLAALPFTVNDALDLHTAVHRAIRRHGGDFDPSFVGSRWQPYVSDKAGYALEEDEELRIGEIAVFQRRVTAGVQMVKAVYAWDDRQNER